MKTFNIVLTLLAFISLIDLASAQTYKGDGTTAMENLQNTTSLYSIVAAQNNFVAVTNNSTQVQQIGNYNTAFTATQSNLSNIQLTQIGNNNGIDMVVSANNISEDVLQVGNNHSFTDINVSRSDLHAANVLQFGANQNLIWIGGQNSISDKMMVSMQGKNQTVIIRNLKN